MNYYSIQGELLQTFNAFEQYANRNDKHIDKIKIDIDDNVHIVLDSNLDKGFLYIKGFKLLMNIMDDGLYNKYNVSHKLLPFNMIGTFDKSVKDDFIALKTFNLSVNWML